MTTILPVMSLLTIWLELARIELQLKLEVFMYSKLLIKGSEPEEKV